VTGTLPNGASASNSFTLTITPDPFTYSSLTASIPTAYIYWIGSGTPYYYVFPAFTPSDASCSVTYTLTTTAYSAYDSTVFVAFSSYSRTITISTTASTKVGSYTLRLTGTITGFTGTAYIDFVITVSATDPCLTPTITTTGISSPQYYDVNDGTILYLANLDWT
jgi:hypothetical protein